MKISICHPPIAINMRYVCYKAKYMWFRIVIYTFPKIAKFANVTKFCTISWPHVCWFKKHSNVMWRGMFVSNRFQTNTFHTKPQSLLKKSLIFFAQHIFHFWDFGYTDQINVGNTCFIFGSLTFTYFLKLKIPTSIQYKWVWKPYTKIN